MAWLLGHDPTLLAIWHANCIARNLKVAPPHVHPWTVVDNVTCNISEVVLIGARSQLQLCCTPCCMLRCTPCCMQYFTPCCMQCCTPCCVQRCTPCCMQYCTSCCMQCCTPCRMQCCTPCCRPYCMPCCMQCCIVRPGRSRIDCKESAWFSPVTLSLAQGKGCWLCNLNV